MESGQVPLEDLEIKLTLAKNPGDYPENRLQRIVGSDLNANQGDLIKYYKSKVKGGCFNPSIIKYKEVSEYAQEYI